MRDVLRSPSNGCSLQDFELTKLFPRNQWMSWHFGGDELAELNRALALASYMAECATDEPEGFARLTSNLHEESWKFALRFCPYHKVHVALENLDTVQSAMLDACQGLNSAMAGMETAFELGPTDRSAYERERSKATSNLLNFSALYASYLDVCRRLRGYCDLKSSAAYKRAIDRIVGDNAGEHSFISGLRNFILHYQLVQPAISITVGETRSVKINLDTNSLLYAGFDWSAVARGFMQSDATIDIVGTTSSVFRDVVRLVKFHRKIARKRLSNAASAYELYVYERRKMMHLHSSAVDVGAIVKRPTTVLSRLVDERVVKKTIESGLSDEDVRTVLVTLADRYRNLSAATKDAISADVDRLLRRRTEYPKTGAYLQGREFPPSDRHDDAT